jgi:hypothetical protein
MGGVSASVEPAFNVNVPLAVPEPLLTVTLMGYVPAAGVVPEIVPEVASMASPVGRPAASNVNGACPVAEIACKNGLPGTEPMTDAPRIRGVAGAGVIEIVMSVWAPNAEALCPDAITETTANQQRHVIVTRSEKCRLGDRSARSS